MTALRSLDTVRPGLYRLPEYSAASDLLIPCFQAARKVQGAFGWFSSAWIAELAPGLAVFLNRNTSLSIEFTVAPAFFKNELEAAEQGIAVLEKRACMLVEERFVKGRLEASALEKHALSCMAWMIATHQLNLRVAVPTADSHFHPKIWLFDDGIDQVLARGSGNATRNGLVSGVEHIDVDVTWSAEGKSRIEKGIEMLEDWTSGKGTGFERVVDLPEAIREKIIRTAPERKPTVSDYHSAVQMESLIGSSSVSEGTSRQRNRLRIPPDLNWQSGKYSHQGQAVCAWEQGSRPDHGIISMATGAGKTLTALICATRVQDRLSGDSFLVVVSAPSLPLISQWCEEIERFGIKAVTLGKSNNEAKGLSGVLRKLASGGTHVIVVTNHAIASERFQRTLVSMLQIRREPIVSMLIADEAHTLGTEKFLNNKPCFFNKRLALSATPVRQYDPDGTEEIFEFFGDSVFEFGLGKAIGLCLAPYKYFVHAGTLAGEELDEYVLLSQRIGMLIARDDEVDQDQDRLRTLVIKRRRVIETASCKIELLHSVLEKRGPRDLGFVLIYASAKDPNQFIAISKILSELNIKWSAVTQETTRDRKLLENTFKAFKDGGLQVLLAKKVLDEGVDIPGIREAFIVASSTVEREWIQRRGRVLRLHPGKSAAVVHDFLALPPASQFQDTKDTGASKIVETELARAYAFAKYAENAAGQNNTLQELEDIENAYWPKKQNQTSYLFQEGTIHIANTTPEGRLW